VLTSPDDDLVKKMNENSMIPGVHLALGNFQKCVNLLKTQIKLSSVDAIKPLMKQVYMSNHAQVKIIPCLQNNSTVVRDSRGGKFYPSSCMKLPMIQSKLNKAFDLGITDEALDAFREIFSMCLFFIAIDKTEENQIKEVLNICAEYSYLIRMNKFRDQFKSDKIKTAEVSCLMTLCKLEQPMHYYFIYNKAKLACKNIKNFLTAIYFCKKILSLEKELEGAEEVDLDKIKKEFVSYQNVGTNAEQLSLNVSDSFPNARNHVDAKNFTLLGSKPAIKCPLCGSAYSQDAANSACENCKLCVLGQECLGMKFSSDF